MPPGSLLKLKTSESYAPAATGLYGVLVDLLHPHAPINTIRRRGRLRQDLRPGRRKDHIEFHRTRLLSGIWALALMEGSAGVEPRRLRLCLPVCSLEHLLPIYAIDAPNGRKGGRFVRPPLPVREPAGRGGNRGGSADPPYVDGERTRGFLPSPR